MPCASKIISFILFADDTTGLVESPNLNELFTTMNTELEKLSKWFIANKLKLNVDKTKWMLFTTRQKIPHLQLNEDEHFITINNINVEQTYSFKFLGLYLDNHLNFKYQITQTHKNISKGIYLLRRVRKFLPTDTLKILYSSLILPYLNYGLLCWGGACKTKSHFKILDQGNYSNHMSILSGLHRLQKKALRIISNSPSKAHHIPLCHSLGILDLEDLYSTKALSFLYDYIHGNLPSTFQDKLHLYFSRNNELLIKIKYRRTDTASRLLYNTLPNIWNHLESNIKTEITKSKKTFITKIKLYYLNKYENFKCSVFNCYSCSHTT